MLTVFLFCVGVVFGQNSDEFDEQEYKIGPEDVLSITVWDNDDLSIKSQVGLDGFISFKYIGRVKAAGLRTAELADAIALKLSEGYINDPQISINVSSYKSKGIFIIGEVNRPGTYYLNKKTKIVEAISMAQGPTKDADTEVIIVRKGGDGDGDILTVDLRMALEGDLKQNVFVKEGDSIFLAKAKTFFIMGEVNRPGQYMLEKDTTVRKAISIAGGHTEKAALNRVKVIRKVKDEESEMDVELDMIVQPLDTIVVPQSYF